MKALDAFVKNRISKHPRRKVEGFKQLEQMTQTMGVKNTKVLEDNAKYMNALTEIKRLLTSTRGIGVLDKISEQVDKGLQDGG